MENMYLSEAETRVLSLIMVVLLGVLLVLRFRGQRMDKDK